MPDDVPARIEVLALDLEGTLVSNAMSQIPRPGLKGFLEFCRSAFPRVVAYTALEEDVFRRVAENLVADRSVPEWFGEVPYVSWFGRHKDLRSVPGCDPAGALLVEDMIDYVHPEQLTQWVAIEAFRQPYDSGDVELDRIGRYLRQVSAWHELPDMQFEQAAAATYRGRFPDMEVLLVTSRNSGRWIFPKGMVDGDSPPEAARREALEEAGARGRPGRTPIGHFRTEKDGATMLVDVFPMRVEETLDDYPEAGLRERRWMPLAEALERVDDPVMEQLLAKLPRALRVTG